MTPENEFKKFLIIILSAVALYVFATSDVCSDFLKSNQSKIVGKFINETEITQDSPEQYTEKETFLSKIFKKKNPYEFWISGNIKINPLSNYNSTSKEQVYTFRKYYVNKTIFKDNNYSPSEEVFGKISDKNLWLGVKALACNGANGLSYKGMTNDSKFINNPAVLIGVDYATFPKKYVKCEDKQFLLPKHLSFSKDDNTFYLTYDISELQADRRLKLVALNARDLGFKYGFCRKTNNIVFANSFDNISKSVYEFKDSIRVDSSCGVRGGCNDNVAFQEELFFNINSFPATFELKLWKEKPNSELNDGDINFTIILE